MVRVSLSNRSGLMAAPALSLEFHREAILTAVDPVTAICEDPIAPTQEGGQRFRPRNLRR